MILISAGWALLLLWAPLSLAGAADGGAEQAPVVFDAAAAQRLAAEVDALREETSQLRRQWQGEEPRLQAELAVYQDLLRQEQGQQEQLQQQLEKLTSEQAQLRAARQRREEFAQQAAALLQDVRQEHRQLRRQSLLGLAATDTDRDTDGDEQAPPAGDPVDDLIDGWSSSLGAIDDDARQARLIRLQVLSGQRPDGQTQAVEVLHIGAAAAWWQALDRRSWGQVAVGEEGQLLLLPSAAPQAIAEAFAQRAGRGLPQPLALPLEDQP